MLASYRSAVAGRSLVLALAAATVGAVALTTQELDSAHAERLCSIEREGPAPSLVARYLAPTGQGPSSLGLRSASSEGTGELIRVWAAAAPLANDLIYVALQRGPCLVARGARSAGWWLSADAEDAIHSWNHEVEIAPISVRDTVAARDVSVLLVAFASGLMVDAPAPGVRLTPPTSPDLVPAVMWLSTEHTGGVWDIVGRAAELVFEVIISETGRVSGLSYRRP